MSDLPSRDHFADLIPGDYRASEASEYRVLQAYASGRLVDHEAIEPNDAIAVLVKRLHEGTAIGLITRHDMRLAIDAALGEGGG